MILSNVFVNHSVDRSVNHSVNHYGIELLRPETLRAVIAEDGFDIGLELVISPCRRQLAVKGRLVKDKSSGAFWCTRIFPFLSPVEPECKVRNRTVLGFSGHLYRSIDNKAADIVHWIEAFGRIAHHQVDIVEN